MPSDIRSSEESGASRHGGRTARLYHRGGGRGGFFQPGSAGSYGKENLVPRRGRRNLCQRDDAIRSGGAPIRTEEARRDHWHRFKSPVAPGAARRNYHRAADRSGGALRFDAPEGRHGAKDGLKHAFYSSDGAAGPRLRQLDD